MVSVKNIQKKILLESSFLKKMKGLAEALLKEEKSNYSDITIILTDNDYIKELNTRFLGRGEPTDVLAFPLNGYAEVYISVEIASERVENKKLQEEILLYVVHGLLHLHGYKEIDSPIEKSIVHRQRYYLKKLSV